MVEYLESTGTQYIDMGILSTNSKIEISFNFNKISGKSEVLVNCNSSTIGWFGLSDNGKIRLDGIEIDGAYNEKNSFILEYKNGIVKAFEEGNIIA